MMWVRVSWEAQIIVMYVYCKTIADGVVDLVLDEPLFPKVKLKFNFYKSK